MYKRYIKRIFDIIISVTAIVVCLIPMLLIALAVKMDDCGPVLFRQERIGAEKKRFWMYKFRTMKVNTPDIPTHLLTNPDDCITRIGRFLRRYSLDELPQLFQILTSKMSLIGPRPALWNQDDLIMERDKYGANEIKPGLTGWAQINGRDEVEISEKARLDGEYAQTLNAGGLKAFAMDFRCFTYTFGKVLRADGVEEGAAPKQKK